MAVEKELRRFVHDALSRGVPRAEIESALIAAGWGREPVRSALAEFAEVPFAVPVPRPRPYLSARDAFVYLVMFTALYIAAFNLGQLLFQFINRAYPDAAHRDSAEMIRNSTRWAIANLVVAFPLYAFLTVSVTRAVQRDPTKRGSRVRKWLTYLTLFIGVAVLIGDVVALVNGVLSGELTVRFVLKVLVVAAIAGTVFGYYLLDLRQDEQEEA